MKEEKIRTPVGRPSFKQRQVEKLNKIIKGEKDTYEFHAYSHFGNISLP